MRHSLDRYVTLNDCDFLDSLVVTPIPHIKDNDRAMANDGKSLPDMVADIEKQIISKALEENRWRKSKTASDLGIHRKTLFTKMKKYNL